MQKKWGARKKPFFVVADTHMLPFNDGCFDFVFTFGSLHHFYSLDDAVKEIRRIVEKGGVFLTSYDPLKPLFKNVAEESCSEVSYGVLENSYSYFEYTSPLKKYFSKVSVVHSKQSERIDLFHKLRRLKGNRLLSRLQALIPKKIVIALRLLWFGVEDFTSISTA